MKINYNGINFHYDIVEQFFLSFLLKIILFIFSYKITGNGLTFLVSQLILKLLQKKMYTRNICMYVWIKYTYFI